MKLLYTTYPIGQTCCVIHFFFYFLKTLPVKIVSSTTVTGTVCDGISSYMLCKQTFLFQNCPSKIVHLKMQVG